MIDIRSEQLLTMKQAPQYTPGTPHFTTIYRWCYRPHDALETVLVGGRRFTSAEAIERFVRRCTGGDTVAPTASRQKQIAQAENELARAGI